MNNKPGRFNVSSSLMSSHCFHFFTLNLQQKWARPKARVIILLLWCYSGTMLREQSLNYGLRLKGGFIHRPPRCPWNQSWRNAACSYCCHCTEGQHSSLYSLILWLPWLDVISSSAAGGDWYNGCSRTEHVSLSQTARILLKIASSIVQLCQRVQGGVAAVNKPSVYRTKPEHPFMMKHFVLVDMEGGGESDNLC